MHGRTTIAHKSLVALLKVFLSIVHVTVDYQHTVNPLNKGNIIQYQTVSFHFIKHLFQKCNTTLSTWYYVPFFYFLLHKAITDLINTLSPKPLL